MASAPAFTHFTVFEAIFKKIDALLVTFVNDASGRAITAITPFVSVCLMIWLLWHAYNVMMGHSQMPIADLIKRCLMWSIVISLALTAGNYQSGIGNVIRTLPNDVASTFLSNTTPDENQLGSLLDKVAGYGVDTAKTIWSQDTGINVGAAIVNGGLGFSVGLTTVILCVVGFFMLALATVTISFLAALGPFFIAAFMFDSTRGYFWSWVSSCLYWVMFLCLFSLMVIFIMKIYLFYGSQANPFTNADWVSAVFAIMIVSFFGVIFFFQIPKVASQLTGGSGHTTLGAVGGLVRTVASTVFALKTLGAVNAVAGGAGAAGQGAKGAASAAAATSAPPRNYNRVA